MRFIRKGGEPQFMSQWKSDQQKAGSPILYDLFPNKKELNDVLRAEQHEICCYCQRRVNHFQGELQDGCHNEHLYPENRPDDSRSVALQMVYDNIYACCIDSRGNGGRMKYLQHCGEAKGNEIIPNLIQHADCSEYFRYNMIGEIIPNGEYQKWNDYVTNEGNLTGTIREAYDAIKVLNLNCCTLVSFRYEMQGQFMSFISSMAKEKLILYRDSYERASTYQECIDMKLQLLNYRINAL